MNPSFQNQLQNWCRKNNVSPPKKLAHHKKPKNRHTEHLSNSEIKSLMGMDIPVFIRHRGALKQR